MKRVIIIFVILFLSSTSLFSAVKVYKGTFKDRGTHQDGRKWVGCWNTQSTCFFTISNNSSNPHQIDNVWIPDEQIGWTNIENPQITNHNDPTHGDYNNLNFELGENTQEHTSYASWEQEATN